VENENRSVDYILVGQGLAGSAVAMQLLKRKKRLLVVDAPSANSASRIAAGLFNPFTGRHFVKTWMADELFPFLRQYYTEAEKITGANFFFPIGMYRPFSSIEEQNEWMGRSEDPGYRPYVSEITTRPAFQESFNDPYGGLLLQRCGYVDTVSYLDAVRQYIGKEWVMGSFFNEELLKVTDTHVEYQGWLAQKVIFCQGIEGLNNKWFKGLPVRPLKGETLTIKTEWKRDLIANRGVYMVPGGVPGEYRVGSTYKFNDDSHSITGEGRRELEEKLKDLIRFPYDVLRQDWGIRPTTKDRRPILGCSVQSDRLVIFNGLGTKGVSLAPYFSEVLICWLENTHPLNKDVDVTRYN
jgi:glycine oxidase